MINNVCLVILVVEIVFGLIRILQINKLYKTGVKRDKGIPINERRKLKLFFFGTILCALFYIGCWLYTQRSIALFIFGATIFVVLIDNLCMKLTKERMGEKPHVEIY